MEKLTKRMKNGIACLVDGEHPGDIAIEALQRLAAYEDTGLEPERVAELAQAEKVVRHGRWLGGYKMVLGRKWVYVKPRCSECGKENNGFMGYCPNCGAKMDEE